MSSGSRRGKAWNATRKLVLDRDGWVCQSCGKLLEGSDATVDHIVPVIAGGSDEHDNLVAMCRLCNGTKSDRLAIRLNWINRRWLARI